MFLLLVQRLGFQEARAEVEMVFFIDGLHVRLGEVGHVLYYHCNIAIVNVKLSHQGGSGLPHQIWIFRALSTTLLTSRLFRWSSGISPASYCHSPGSVVVMMAKTLSSEINNIEPSIFMSFIIG